MANCTLFKAAPHKARLTDLHEICLHKLLLHQLTPEELYEAWVVKGKEESRKILSFAIIFGAIRAI